MNCAFAERCLKIMKLAPADENLPTTAVVSTVRFFFVVAANKIIKAADFPPELNLEPRQIGAAFFSRLDPSDAAVCSTERRAADVVMMPPPLRRSRNNKTQTFGSFLKTQTAEKLQRSRCNPPFTRPTNEEPAVSSLC